MKIVQTGPGNIVKSMQQVAVQLSRVHGRAVNQIYADFQDRRAALVLEQARLAARHGPRSNQARLAQAKIERFDVVNAALAADVDRANILAPAADPKGFVVYGRVLDRKGNGLPKLQVAAIDSNETTLASGPTAEKGAFSFTVSVSASLSKGSENTLPTLQFRLRVSDSQGKTLLRDTEVLEAVPGRLAYRELMLYVSADAG